jgi:hypothetical protein
MQQGIVEILSGCVVEDATGLQLGVFYGRTAPNNAGYPVSSRWTARQMAIDLASCRSWSAEGGLGQKVRTAMEGQFSVSN